MAPRKRISPKKPPARKRRVNSMLGTNNEAPSSSQVAGIDITKVDVPATPAPKAPSLRLVITSRKTTTPSLRLNAPKPPEQQRPEPVTESLINLIQPSSPLPSQLPKSLNSIPPPDLPASKRRQKTTFNQMLASQSLSLMGRSESPCSYRSSQSDFATRIRASIATQSNTQLDSYIDSQIDSQAIYDNEENREERRREKEASNTARAQNSQRSRQQKDSKESVNRKAKI